MALMDFLSRTVEGLFFEVSARRYWRFEHFGLVGEPFLATAPDGSAINAWFLPAQPEDGRPVRASILHCHACTHNMSFHLPQISWLVAAGYNVVMFDYRGVGESAGRLSLQGLSEDARAVLEAALKRPAVAKGDVFLFGQGVGAEAAVKLARDWPERVAGVVLESLYARHRTWMLRRYGPGVGHLCGALLPKGVEDPVSALSAVRVPLVLVLPTKDKRTPEGEVSDVLHAAPKTREVWRAEGKKYLGVFDYPGEWRERFLSFLEAHTHA